MRLRVLRNKLEEARPHLTIANQYIPKHNTTEIFEFRSIKNAVYAIELTGLFHDTISRLKDLDFWNGFTEVMTLQPVQLDSFIPIISELKILVEAMIDSLNLIIPPDRENTISIKIPDPKSLKDISNSTESLDKIFNQTLLHHSLNGSVEILNFDMGSFWIDIALGGGVAVMHFVSSLAWGAAVTFKKIQEGLLVRQQVREMTLDNDLKEKFLNGVDDADNAVAQNEATHIANEHYKEFTAEDVERIKFALKELANIYIKGGEIHLSLMAPEEVKKGFPKMKELNSISSKIKEIPKNTASGKAKQKPQK